MVKDRFGNGNSLNHPGNGSIPGIGNHDSMWPHDDIAQRNPQCIFSNMKMDRLAASTADLLQSSVVSSTRT